MPIVAKRSPIAATAELLFVYIVSTSTTYNYATDNPQRTVLTLKNLYSLASNVQRAC